MKKEFGLRMKNWARAYAIIHFRGWFGSKERRLRHLNKNDWCCNIDLRDCLAFRPYKQHVHVENMFATKVFKESSLICIKTTVYLVGTWVLISIIFKWNQFFLHHFLQNMLGSRTFRTGLTRIASFAIVVLKQIWRVVLYCLVYFDFTKPKTWFSDNTWRSRLRN